MLTSPSLSPRTAGVRPAHTGITLRLLLALWMFAAALIPVGHAADTGTETTNNPTLTLDRILKGGEFSGEGYGEVRWRKRGGGYFRWESGTNGLPGQDLVLVDAASGEKSVMIPGHLLVPPGKSSALNVEDYALSDDESRLLIYTNSRRVWRHNSRGDYWVLDIAARELKQLGGEAKPASLMFATLSPDGTRAAYVMANNLYVQSLIDWRITPLTRDGSESVINGTFDWVYEEELALQNGFRWSPDSRRVAYWQSNTEGLRKFGMLQNLAGLYPELISFGYPKVGQQNSAVRVGTVSAEGGDTAWIDLPGDSRNHYIARMDWAEGPAELVIQQFNRLQNTNRVFLADVVSGAARLVHTEVDAAWVDNENAAPFIDGGKRFLWLSDRSGWKQLYSVNRSGGDVDRLTQGELDLVDLNQVDATNRVVYFTASPTNATQRYLYQVPFHGGKPKRVTPGDQPGVHRYVISEDGRYAVHTWSNFDTPPVVDLVRLPGHERVRWLEENTKLKEKLKTLARPASEFFRIDIGQGVNLDAWSLTPPGFDRSRRYPVLFHVYGEPAGASVMDSWPGVSWHWMLAQRGWVVIGVENRGTPAPRGRDLRKASFRKIGILNIADQAAAARALLKQRPYLDPERVAIWGWSGGGSSTLNALFQYPEVYRAGIAVAPVPVQRYYDTIYQERYMGLPGDNPEGYRLGSPITHAHKLKGALLLVHGTGDDNVHYQGSEALINELVAHNKQFTLMAYPGRSHSIHEGLNTTRHLHTLMTEFLERHVPPGPR